PHPRPLRQAQQARRFSNDALLSSPDSPTQQQNELENTTVFRSVRRFSLVTRLPESNMQLQQECEMCKCEMCTLPIFWSSQRVCHLFGPEDWLLPGRSLIPGGVPWSFAALSERATPPASQASDHRAASHLRLNPPPPAPASP